MAVTMPQWKTDHLVVSSPSGVMQSENNVLVLVSGT
jgi:hypothetical protein